MGMSNQTGAMVIATGNKSEMAVGYATLYGDLGGGFALLKDLYKTEVYELANYRNSIEKVIPENIITKEPSAELKEDQLDTDSLPEYPVLDKILYMYIEENLSSDEIINVYGFFEIKFLKFSLFSVKLNKFKSNSDLISINISYNAGNLNIATLSL